MTARILLVDDNQVNRDMLSRRLLRAGHDVDMAEDGYIALEKIATAAFDVVLLDIMMPGIDGNEVLSRIRDRFSSTELPVIMVTAKDDSDSTVHSLGLGANDYVTKPIDFPVLQARIERQQALKADVAAKLARAGGAPQSLLESDDPEALRAVIAAGESDDLEFKSTLRWNLKADRKGKEIEMSALKTIVAYLNSDGGTLLVGVEDDGNILGIEPDRFPSEDNYLLHVNNLVRNHIGLAFSSLIRFGLHPAEGRKVLVVECEPSPNPAFLKHDGDEAFYVRVGPGSRKLTTRETLSYLQNRDDSQTSDAAD